jgi:hypothetical protein
VADDPDVGSSVHLQRSAPARPLAPAREPIRFQHPEMPPMDAVLAYFRRSEQAGWFSNGGPCSIELTARLEQRLGAGTHAVLVSNATMGLLAALGAACRPPPAG